MEQASSTLVKPNYWTSQGNWPDNGARPHFLKKEGLQNQCSA